MNIEVATKSRLACSFAGCNREARSRGLCSGHLGQHYKGIQLRPIGAIVLRRPPEFDGAIVRIALTRGKVAVIDQVDADLAAFNWCSIPGKSTWYPWRKGGEENGWLHRVIATRAGLKIVGFDVDHRNLDGLDCRRSNLRVATRAQNTQNVGLLATNSSGAKGVCWHMRDHKWTAQIMANGKRVYLGGFKTADEAAIAYAMAAATLHGEFARLR